MNKIYLTESIINHWYSHGGEEMVMEKVMGYDAVISTDEVSHKIVKNINQYLVYKDRQLNIDNILK